MKQKWILLLLVLIASASMAANFFLARCLLGRYEAQLIQQVWPVGAVYPPMSSAPTSDSGDVVLLVGDSRVAEWGLPSLAGGRTVNAGQMGATTGQIRLRIPELLDQVQPSVVVIQVGINDLKLAGLRPDLSRVLVEHAAGNVSNIVAQCTARKCRVLLLETWPVGKPDLLRRLIWDDEVPTSVGRLNEALRTLHAPSNGVRVVDLFKTAAVAPGPESFRDALHFDLAIYSQLTPVLDRELAGLHAESR